MSVPCGSSIMTGWRSNDCDLLPPSKMTSKLSGFSLLGDFGVLDTHVKAESADDGVDGVVGDARSESGDNASALAIMLSRAIVGLCGPYTLRLEV